jgi:hypothetical protein
MLGISSPELRLVVKACQTSAGDASVAGSSQPTDEANC